jgi:hypothetical protein
LSFKNQHIGGGSLNKANSHSCHVLTREVCQPDSLAEPPEPPSRAGVVDHGFTVTQGTIDALDILYDPERLAAVDLAVPED